MDQIDEHEQGERVRAWLKNNGSSLVMGVALGLGALGGWQWWQGQQENEKVVAAGEFLAFSQALEAGETNKAEAFAQSLRESHADSPYPALVALNLAARQLGEGKAEDALATLDGVNREGLEAGLSELLALRAARVLVAMGRHEDALARLAALGEASHYPASAAELRGDAEMALGRRDAARAAYEQALAQLDEAAPTRSMIEMKLTYAGSPTAGEPEA
jgi:predicted negative regulator of RcsB-dependent stress response